MVIYTRIFSPASPQVGLDTFKLMIRKRKLSQLRAALLDDADGRRARRSSSGAVNCVDDSDSLSSHSQDEQCSDEDDGSIGSGCSSPSRRSPGRHDGHKAASAAGQEDSDKLLEEVRASIHADHEAARQAKVAEKQAAAEQCAAVREQLSSLEGELEQLNERKHQLVQQLKQVGGRGS